MTPSYSFLLYANNILHAIIPKPKQLFTPAFLHPIAYIRATAA